MKTIIIVQARMTSTRLPGKILKTVLGKSLLEYQIERLKRVQLADEIVIATTINNTDQPIVEFCERLNVPYYRGSEENVLSRYYEAAIRHNADVVVRVTSDCPLIDPLIIDEIIDYFLRSGNYDYVSNTIIRTYPRGMDVEVFSMNALEEAYIMARESGDLEHVTMYIYKHKERYSLANCTYNEDLSAYRWTVDTIEDFQLIDNIIKYLYITKPNFTLQDCVELLDEYPEWNDINACIEQKK